MRVMVFNVEKRCEKMCSASVTEVAEWTWFASLPSPDNGGSFRKHFYFETACTEETFLGKKKSTFSLQLLKFFDLLMKKKTFTS